MYNQFMMHGQKNIKLCIFLYTRHTSLKLLAIIYSLNASDVFFVIIASKARFSEKIYLA